MILKTDNNNFAEQTVTTQNKNKFKLKTENLKFVKKESIGKQITKEENDRNIRNNLSYFDAPFAMKTIEQYSSENTIITKQTELTELNKMNNIFSGFIDKNENSECKH